MRENPFHDSPLEDMAEEVSYSRWEHDGESGMTLSVETVESPIDKYAIGDFATDDPLRFQELVSHLCPRDQEVMLCFAILQKRPTDLSRLFGKAGHRAQEDLHKAAHKLAGLIAFGPLPDIGTIDSILSHHQLSRFRTHSLAACIWEYARCRDFEEVSRLIGTRGLRQQILRTFKILHAAEGREEGLLAGWLLWLVDGSDPRGTGWKKCNRVGYRKIGPTVFSAKDLNPPATGRGGQGQKPATVKITRRMKFIL